MRNYQILMVFFLTSCAVFHHKILRSYDEQHLTNHNTLRVQFLYKNPYCGGIKPSDEMLSWYATEHPLSSTYLVLVYEDSIRTHVKTDSLGYFLIDTTFSFVNIHLDSSHLCMHLPAPTCKKYYAKPLVTLRKQDGFRSKIVISFPCNPCEPFGGKRP